MPHLIIEYSSDIKKSEIKIIKREIQAIMTSITEGNFDLNQCKARSFSFAQYLVGALDQETSSFIHITIKILAGRGVDVRKKLAEKIMEFTKNFYEKLVFSPTETDQITAITTQVADLVSGIPHPQLPMQNSHLAGKRCDISVDIVEMDCETYQKTSLQN